MSEPNSTASKNKLSRWGEQTCYSCHWELNGAMQISFHTITDDPHLHARQPRFNIGGQGVLRPQALLVKWPINQEPCWEPVSAGLVQQGGEQSHALAGGRAHQWPPQLWCKAYFSCIQLWPTLAKGLDYYWNCYVWIWMMPELQGFSHACNWARSNCICLITLVLNIKALTKYFCSENFYRIETHYFTHKSHFASYAVY